MYLTSSKDFVENAKISKKQRSKQNEKENQQMDLHEEHLIEALTNYFGLNKKVENK